MSLKIIGDSGYEADVNSDKALYVEVRPPALGGHGAYIQCLKTSFITATLASGSDLFSWQWSNPNSFCQIRSIAVSGMVTSTITTGVQFSLAAYLARSYTSHDTGGIGLRSPETGTGSATTAGDGYVFSPDNAKLRREFPAAMLNDSRCAYTVALTQGTRVLDSQPLNIVSTWTGTAVGTFLYKYGSATPLIDRTAYGQHPIILAKNEGIIIQNFTAGPATGSFTLQAFIEWKECWAY